MKNPCIRKNSGSVLLATMILVVAIALFLEAYLYVVENSNQSTARGQQWNAALPVAEAGIEEGLAKINQIAITTNINAVGFSLITRGLNGGSYDTFGSAAGVVSTITSTGIVSAPINGDNIRRAVRVTAQRQALISKGIVSMTNITLNGGGDLSIDSYNSHDPRFSSNGQYVASMAVATNGDVAAVAGFVNVGNHHIGGNLYLGPDATYSSQPNGGVTGTIYYDWNMQFPDASLPADDSGQLITPTPAPSSGSKNNIIHNFTTSGYYSITDDGGISVDPGVSVVLSIQRTDYNPSSLTISGGTTNSGTVVMYQSSGTMTLSGSAGGGAINNRPENFTYFGLHDVTKITLSGSSSFVGVIYAPEAALFLSGGGSGNNLQGSVIVYSITINGGYQIHYDTSLLGYYYGYFVVGSWEELAPPSGG